MKLLVISVPLARVPRPLNEAPSPMVGVMKLLLVTLVVSIVGNELEVERQLHLDERTCRDIVVDVLVDILVH